MFPKPIVNPYYDVQKITEKLDGTISTIYTFLVIGWLVEIVGFSAEKINYSGTQFTLQNKDAFPGVIYVICLLYYLKFIVSGFYYGFSIGINNRIMIKRAVRYSWIKARTGKREVRNPIGFTKLLARFLLRAWFVMLNVGLFFPLFYIAIFRLASVWKAVHWSIG